MDGTQGLAPPVLSFLTGLFTTEPTLTPSARAAVANHLVGLIEAMLVDTRLNPQMVADSVHISARYLHQIFKQAGMTCSSHIRLRRLERVRADLALQEFTMVPVEQLLQRWGIQNPSHFGQVFKSIEGCTPTDFRRKMLGTSDAF